MKFNNYKNINDLKNASDEELQELSKDIRELIHNQVINEEGHLGSNMAITDLTLSLVRRFGTDHVRYLFDTSYQAYAFKMVTGRKDFLSQIHTPDGYNVFQEISEGDPYSGGHTSVSAIWASGYNTLKDNKLNIEIMGDGALASSVGLGGMLNFAKTDQKNLFILNDNKQGIGINQFNYLNWEKIAQGMNYDFYEVEDGHDYKQLEAAWNFFDKSKKNVFVKVNTIKGYGLDIPNKEEALHYYVKPHKNSNPNTTSTMKFLVNELLANKLKSPDTMIFMPGMNYTFGLSELKKQYPDQIIDAGIAEEVSVVEAAAAAITGKDVYFLVHASFSQRIYDQIVHDIMRNNIPMKIIISSTGVTPMGDSHHGIYDLNMYNGFENIYIYQPTTTGELTNLVNLPINNPVVIRVTDVLDINESKDINWKWLNKDTTSKKVVISYSNLANSLNQYVKDNNLNINVIKAVGLNPIDQDVLDYLFDNDYQVYTYEPVFWKNNLASTIRTKYPTELVIDFSFNKPIIGKWDLNSIFVENKMDLKSVIEKIKSN